MHRVLTIVAMIAALVSFGPPAYAGGGNSDAPSTCRSAFRTYGFDTAGGCVSFLARGGTLTQTAPRLTVIGNGGPCAANPAYPCAISLRGEGLKPGTTVMLSSPPTVTYGVPFTVDQNGRVSADYIYNLGSCVMPGYEVQQFIARGTAPDGSAVESAITTVDLSQYVSTC